MAKADGTGLDFSTHVANGALALLWQPPLEVIPDSIAERILEEVEARKVQRVFLDGLEGLQQVAVYPERMARFVTALMNELCARGVTVFLSAETRSPSFAEANLLPDEVVLVAGTVIQLRQIEVGANSYRLINVAKRRHGPYDARIHAFTISDAGVRVAATSESAARILGRGSPSPASRGLSVEAEEGGEGVGP